MDSKILERCATEFEKNGYTIIEDYLNEAEVDELKGEVNSLFNEHVYSGEIKHEPLRIMHEERADTGKDLNLYYQNSYRGIGFFHEDIAAEVNGGDLSNLDPEERKKLYDRIGHGLHVLSKPFNEFLTSEKMKQIFHAIGVKDMTVYLGFVLLKPAKNGRGFTAHQDAHTCFTVPDSPAFSGWIPLEDSTIENGCLEFWPGSHTMPYQTRVLKNHDRKKADDPLFKNVVFDNTDHETVNRDKFVKKPMKRGTLVIFHGNVLHRSEPNLSDKPRMVFAFFGYDSARGNISKDVYMDLSKTLLLHINNKAVEFRN